MVKRREWKDKNKRKGSWEGVVEREVYVSLLELIFKLALL